MYGTKGSSMTACAIMQPTYLPWPGYFNLMEMADIFVILDDAQFQRSSWHCRNQILLGGKPMFLTVPIKRTGLSSRLTEAQIDYARDWAKSHEGKVRQAYSRTQSGKLVIEAIMGAWHSRPERLIDLNLSIITALAELLDITTPFVMASDLGIGGERSDRLLGICKSLGAEHYLSPAGSAEYLREDGFCNQSDVILHLQNFEYRPYSQFQATGFVPYMSVIDVMANLGSDAASEYIRNPAFADF
jgi:hypothetical protein